MKDMLYRDFQELLYREYLEDRNPKAMKKLREIIDRRNKKHAKHQDHK